MKRIYLVDVSSLFFRAFYAVRPLSSPKGLPVNAIYGFLSMLLKLMKDEKPDLIVFCYDRKEPSFRKDLYQEYKANRSEMPEDLAPQIPYIKKIAVDLGIPSIEVPGFEADDLIGTMVQVGARHKCQVYIVSGDKDFAQLLRPNVWIYDTMKNVKIGPAEAKEKWGVTPDQMIDYLALCGDSSDNIPGVKGIGPKGAQKLLEEFKTLEGIYENLDQVKGSTHEKLVASRDHAFLSKKLVTIVTDVPMPADLEHYHLRAVDQKATRELMTELNFKGFEKALTELPNWNGQPAMGDSSSSKPAPASKKKSKKGEDPDEEVALAAEIEREEESTVLSETQSVRVSVASASGRNFKQHEGNVAMLAPRFKTGQSIWGFMHELGLVLGDAEKNEVFLLKDEPAKICKFLDEKDMQWKGFDLKVAWHQLELRRPRPEWDAQLAAYVVKAGESSDWEQVYARYCGEVPQVLASPSEKMNEFLALENALNEKLGVNRKILSEIEMPVLPILYRMEKRGIRLDQNLLGQQSQELVGEIKSLETDIHELAGEAFNIGSPKQLGTILFEKLKLPVGRKTKTGYSTDTDVLDKLRSLNPIADKILKYREYTKLKSTYLDALPLMVREDGRIHTTFNQAHTATGRLSSVDPNLQNIPIRTERGARVRRAFVADEGNYLMSVDYSQVELRILAHYTDDENMIKAFRDDVDIHAATASEVFNVPLKEVTSDQRRTAKAVNFGIAYGQGAFGLADVLGIPRNEAQEIIKRYFERFKGVKTYIEDTVKIATEKGFVETLSGRRRYMDELKSANPAMRKFGERAAINAPIQGTAADLVKQAMIEVDRTARSPLLLQVHDELIFEATREQLQQEEATIIRAMESVAVLKVPLKVNGAIGLNWDEAHG